MYDFFLAPYHLLKWEEILDVEDVPPKALLADVRISLHRHVPLRS
jgi:hypothetical protein